MARAPRRSSAATAVRWVIGSVVVVVIALVAVGLADGEPTPEQQPVAKQVSSDRDAALLRWDAAEALCDSGGAKPVADAEPYVPGGEVDRVRVLMENENHDNEFTVRKHQSRNEFETSDYETFTLVACMEVRQPATRIKTCTGYEGGATAELMEGSFDLTLYEAKTGRVLANKPGWTEEPKCDSHIPVGASNTTTLWPSYDEALLGLFLYPFAME